MSLSKKDVENVTGFWATAKAKAEEIGTETLTRTLWVYPQTKTYFSHWKDLNPGSESIKKHGGIIIKGVADAVEHITTLKESLLPLSELHAFQLRVDPANFKIINHNLLVVFAILFPHEFTPEVHVSVDKFLANVALGLSEKYR